jgi:hypothetical protein
MALVDNSKTCVAPPPIPESVWSLVQGISDHLVECECTANSIHHSLLGSPLVQTGEEPGESMQDVLYNIRGRLCDLREHLINIHTTIGTL